MPNDPHISSPPASPGAPVHSGAGTPRRTAEERLRRLAERRDRLAHEMAALEARSRTEARRRDDRRKFMLGGFLLQELAVNPRLGAYVAARLAAWLTRPSDRELLGDLSAAPTQNVNDAQEDVA